MLSFPSHITNNPSLKGELAAPKQFLCDDKSSYRWAIAPVHTRFDEVEWFVWDAEVFDMETGLASVIRQETSLEKAVEGLV